MFINDCLNNPLLDFLQCFSTDRNISECVCATYDISGLRIQNLKNTDIYRDLHFKDKIKDKAYSFEPNTTEFRIMDCFDKLEEAFWICNTYGHDKDKTICKCYDSCSKFISMQFVQTHELYRNYNDLSTEKKIETNKNIKNQNSEIKKNIHDTQNIQNNQQMINIEKNRSIGNEYLILICISLIFSIFLFIYIKIKFLILKRKKYIFSHLRV